MKKILVIFLFAGLSIAQTRPPDETLASFTNANLVNAALLKAQVSITMDELNSALEGVAFDTTGLWLMIHNEVKAQIDAILLSEPIIGTKATVDSMIIDFRKNNVIRLNK